MKFQLRLGGTVTWGDAVTVECRGHGRGGVAGALFGLGNRDRADRQRFTLARAAEVLNAGGFPTAALRGEVYTLDQLDEALSMLDRKTEGRDAVRINLVHP